MKLHLISFSSPEEKYMITMNRFHREALNMEIFESINLFSEKNCFQYCNELLEHKHFMESTRAYGFWIWKSFLISQLMTTIPEDDIVCYADVGCTFNPLGKERMNDYLNYVMDFGSLCFDIFHPEKEYTKFDTYFRIFPYDKSYLDSGQRCATTYFLKNNQKNKNIVSEFKSISIENNYHYIDDSQSLIKNSKTFKDHRFDQSIFSLLSKKYNFYCISDETYWNSNWETDGKKYPIWATRLR